MARVTSWNLCQLALAAVFSLVTATLANPSQAAYPGDPSGANSPPVIEWVDYDVLAHGVEVYGKVHSTGANARVELSGAVNGTAAVDAQGNFSYMAAVHTGGVVTVIAIDSNGESPPAQLTIQ